MYGDKMEKIRFQICEKELTLYTAQGGRRGCALGAEPRKSLPGRGDAKCKRYQGDTGSVKNELRL